ncbi:MAG: FHA domain-containing serine/threonine-protein kinase [Actinomycetota bacterium]
MASRGPSTPPVIAGYSYVKILGSGGFSDVFLYEQKLPKRRVAVKVLLAEELTAADRGAFVAEANVMARLSTHPYIVTIYQADVSDDGRPYFVLEYCSGPTLSEQYKRGTVSVPDALRIGIRLSGAVATAHTAGILHRDIKPANVLTNDYGWPALTDFGIASAVEDELPETTTPRQRQESESGATVGMSVPWSPPEMFEDDPQPDVRSDLYSLAATIYTLLSGRSPFEVPGRSNTTLDLIGRIERGAITPMERSDLPATLLAVLTKGMAPDRKDRYATVVDFARALQRIEIELGYPSTAIDVPLLDVRADSSRLPGEDSDSHRTRPPIAAADHDGRTIVVPILRKTVAEDTHPRAAEIVAPIPPPPPAPPPVPAPPPPKQQTAKTPVAPSPAKAIPPKPASNPGWIVHDVSVTPDRLLPTMFPDHVIGWRLELMTEDRVVALRTAALLGRTPAVTPDHSDADLVAIVDPHHSVSGTHALIEVRGDRPWVSDLSSTNGTFVVYTDGEAIEVLPGESAAVPEDATVELGEYIIRVRRG